MIFEAGTGGPFWNEIYKETASDSQSRATLALSAADAISATQDFKYTIFALMAPTLAGIPAATPPPVGCIADRPVSAVTKVVPDMPEEARAAHVTGTVIVRVQLDANGKVISTTVERSSNDKAADDAAVLAARTSKYNPEIHNCVPMPGSYRYAVTFES